MKSALLTVGTLAGIWTVYGGSIAIALHTVSMWVINHLSLLWAFGR